jgi:hypothetical protein
MMIEKELQMSNEFKSWEEMSVLEQMQCQFWDMYKDAYGSRPRGIDTTEWTEEEFMAEFETLGRVIEREEIARKEAEAEALLSLNSMSPIQFAWVRKIVPLLSAGLWMLAKQMVTGNTSVTSMVCPMVTFGKQHDSC